MKQTDEQTAEEILRELNEKYNFRPDDEDEIEGLLSDEEFGLRWKNGASDRRVRGAKKPEGSVYPDRTTVSTDEIFEFIERYMLMFDEVSSLMLHNTMIIESVADGELAYFNKTVNEVMDIDCEGITAAEFNFFSFRMRFGFMKHAATILNALATAAEYAKFVEMSEPAIRKQMERGKLEIVTICGVKFIAVPEDRVFEWNKYIMEKHLRKDIDSVDADNRSRISKMYEKLYGETVDAEDSVLRWVLSEEIYASFLVGAYKSRYAMSEAYQEYSRGNDDAVPLRVFASRIYEMGFKRYNTGKRGFYCWRKEK